MGSVERATAHAQYYGDKTNCDGATVPARAAFDYEEAFSRNLGWLTEREQSTLRGRRVAIAGLGGVGGYHLLALARLGVGAFSLAEFDAFEVQNFNRQAGATVSALGRPKLDVMAEMAREINPEVDLRLFPEGVTKDNVSEFLAGADAYADGLDFFAFAARRLTFAACSRLRVPAVTAAPLGMGCALLTFLPGSMTFEEYFDLGSAEDDHELALRFLVGLSPAMLQRSYLADPSRVDFFAGRGPSTVMACHLCAGMLSTDVLKILLGRGPLAPAPRVVHFDAYRHRLVRSWRPFGNRNPIQRIAMAIARRQLAAFAAGRDREHR
jgi:molybdopterin/thiamine biosynthesis adenylyltransferase